MIPRFNLTNRRRVGRRWFAKDAPVFRVSGGGRACDR
jgi:hypothetical protein